MPVPLYRQIADDLREQIKSGALRPGQQLPTEAELREHHKASRNTVRDAIDWLTRRGLVESRAGQGTFVPEEIEPFVTVLTADPKVPGGSGVKLGQQQKEAKRSLVDVGSDVATAKVATRLGRPAGSDVIYRLETLTVSDTIWSQQASYYPWEFAEKGASRLLLKRDIKEGTVEYLAKTLDLRESRYRDLITVRSPEDDETKLFKLPEDGRIQVFEIFWTAFDQHGEPMRLTITVCPTDRNHLVHEGIIPTSH